MFEIRVKPGSRRTHVGGTWGDPPVLLVQVQERATDGKANAAVRKALAAALDVPRGRLQIISGHRGRTKRIAVADPPAGLAARLDRLRRGD